MSEVHSRRTVVENLRFLGAHCQRIEDSLQPGIFDLNFCYKGTEAWVEFKFVESYKIPKRATTPLRIGLTPEQALWGNQRYLAGGRVAVLTRFEALPGVSKPGWTLHRHHFNDIRDGVPISKFFELADTHWEGDFKPRAGQIIRMLTGRLTPE